MVNIPYGGLANLYANRPTRNLPVEQTVKLASDTIESKFHVLASERRENDDTDRQLATNSSTAEMTTPGEIHSLYCKEVQLPPLPNFERFTKLSITDDRLDGIAHLPTTQGQARRQAGGKGPAITPAALLDTPAGELVTFGKYTLRPQPSGRGWYSRLYTVHHPGHPDQIATLTTHPYKGCRTQCAFHIENPLHYTGQALELLIGLLDAIGATGETLTHWEIQATHPRLMQVAKYIHGNDLHRKGGRNWIVKVKEGRKMEGMQVGRQASPRSFNMYRNGKDLERRNRQYIAARTVADGVATPDQQKKLARLELHIRGREFKGLTYADDHGEEQPVTIRSLINPTIRLAVFRRQIDTAFVFRKPIVKDKYATARFFDWEAIEHHYNSLHGLSASQAPDLSTSVRRQCIYARSGASTYAAKQTVKKLIQDGRQGEYLRPAIQPEIEQATRDTLQNADRVEALIESLSAMGCSADGEEVKAAITAYMNTAAATIADKLSHQAPRFIAYAVAREHGITDYWQKQSLPHHVATP